MITIQSVMLVALGFLLATLLALVLAPAYRARAMRLTYRHIRRTIPLTDAELRLDRDRLRAQYAVRIHDLETKLEKARLTAARQQVDVNRRDASITQLESERAQLRADLEQNVNARHVLEQTITDRIPNLEQRLAETRNLLEQRDRELASITSETSKSVRALDEVMQINAQQRSEIERLNAIVATRTNRSRGDDKRFESEVALRSELEALRAKTRDQESLIARLQAVIAGPGTTGTDVLAQANGSDAHHDGDRELERLRRDLAEAEATLKSVGEQSASTEAGETALKSKVQSLDAVVEEQAATIRRLEAALAAYEKGDAAGRSISLKDSKLAMKARIAALQTEVEDRTATVQKLRAELASANERLALQSAQHMEEMRRLRTGAPGAPSARRQAISSARRSLAERIGEANPALAASIRTPISYRESDPSAPPSTEERTAENGPPAPSTASATGSPQPNGAFSHINGADMTSANEPDKTGISQPETPGKARLLDRLATLSKP